MKRRLVASLALLLACLAPGPAHAQNAPLVAVSGTARYALAADGAAFLEATDPVTRATLQQALGWDDSLFAELWSQIMAGAIQLRREFGEDAETLWFNPLFDAGLAIAWRLEPDGWQAVAAVPVTGEQLRGEAFGITPGTWRGSAIKPLIEARARASWQGAAERTWIGLIARDAGTTAMLRAHAAERSLDEMRLAPGYQGAVFSAWQGLVTGDEATLPEGVRRGLAITGLNARMTLRPVAAFQRPDGWTLAMQSPDAPRLVWLAHFTDPPPGGSAMLRGYQLADMGEVP
ncbi:MAG: hypothetical protein N2423_07405 [Novosphingobium sp.]|nr:hypothetical protein [Novosphingobium sp.]